MVTENLCATYTGVHRSAKKNSPRLYPFLCCVHPRASARLCCGIGWFCGLQYCGCRNGGGYMALWTWAASVANLSQDLAPCCGVEEVEPERSC